MDVGLLRPSMVPIPPDTTFWFEFLLKPDLLESHLQKPDPDPPPHELLVKFLVMSADASKTKNDVNNDQSEMPERRYTKKQLALKLLSLKILAYWSWDLDRLFEKIPVQLQYMLLKAFLYISKEHENEKCEDSFTTELNIESITDREIVALSMFHRWVLKVVTNCSKIPKQLLAPCVPNFPSPIDLIKTLHSEVANSASVLYKISEKIDKEFIPFPTYNTFVPPTEVSDSHQEWDKCLQIPAKKFLSQILYEIGIYKFHTEAYSEAEQYFSKCGTMIQSQGTSSLEVDNYCLVDKVKLTGFCRASGMDLNLDESLTVRFHADISNHYVNVISILQQDNLKREIPMSYRDRLELDIQSMLSCGKFTASRDLMLQIQTLNAVRRVLDGSLYPPVQEFASKFVPSKKCVDVLIKVLKPVISAAINDNEKSLIRKFLTTLIEKHGVNLINEFSSCPEIKQLLSTYEPGPTKSEIVDEIHSRMLQRIKNDAEKNIKMFGNPRLDIRTLEQKIIQSYNPVELRECISGYISLHLDRSVVSINKWEVPLALENALQTLPSSFLQQYFFVLLAKVKELISLQNFSLALDLLRVISKEAENNRAVKFHQIITWEIVYVGALELEVKWPAKYLDVGTIAGQCKSCLTALQQNLDMETVPRLEVMEQVIITLLNLSEWEYIATNTYTKTFRYLELTSDISDACLDAVKYKGTRKFPVSLWDKVLGAFLKAGVSGGSMPKLMLVQFLAKTRDIMVINVLTSLLVKLCNHLHEGKDEEFFYPYSHLWPSTVPSTAVFSRHSAVEVLYTYVRDSLRFHPHNPPLLKLTGDMHFWSRYYADAMKHYLQAIIVVSEYFMRSISKSLIEDDVYRRMIKCCMELQNYIQAAVLCQFLDSVDYATAFRCLAETSSLDALDSYYDCIWDVNILEYLIYLHTTRNEHYKKQRVINLIGQLELNVSNNEDIKREAANVRKQKFLRALTRHYCLLS